MSPSVRRGAWLTVPAVVPALAALAVLARVVGPDLKARSTLVAVGMPRERPGELFGPPAPVLGRSGGRGKLLAWVDPFWQVDVSIGLDGRAESVQCGPSDSAHRRTMGRLAALFW